MIHLEITLINKVGNPALFCLLLIKIQQNIYSEIGLIFIHVRAELRNHLVKKPWIKFSGSLHYIFQVAEISESKLLTRYVGLSRVMCIYYFIFWPKTFLSIISEQGQTVHRSEVIDKQYSNKQLKKLIESRRYNITPTC